MALIIFSVIGMAAFRAGKRDAEPKVLLLGIALMVYPYFISDTLWLWIVGVGLTIGWFKLQD